MTKKDEQFKPINTYKSRYDISNKGRVWSNISNRFLKGYINDNGYRRYVLRKNGNTKHVYCHALVCSHFVKNSHNYKNVNHKDGNKLNNYYKNLEWCTKTQNMKHACKTGLCDNSGEKNGMSKLTKNDVIQIRNAYNLGCFYHKEIAKAWNISRTTVTNIVNNKCWVNI